MISMCFCYGELLSTLSLITGSIEIAELLCVYVLVGVPESMCFCYGGVTRLHCFEEITVNGRSSIPPSTLL